MTSHSLTCDGLGCFGCGPAPEPAMVWAVCQAPAGACGRGLRARQLVRADRLYCGTCGSQCRVAKNQEPTKEKSR